MHAGPDQQSEAGGTVVGPVRAVLARASPEFRPDVNEDAVGESTRLEVALEGHERVGRQLERRVELVGLVGVGVVHARCLQRGAANRQSCREHRRQPREAAREVVRRLRVRGRDLADARAEPLQLAPEPMRLRGRGGDFADRAVTTPQVGGPELSDRIEDPGLERGRIATRGERVAVGPVDRRDRDLPGRERGLETVVEREALERVVRRSDPVEVAAEPPVASPASVAPTSQ